MRKKFVWIFSHFFLKQLEDICKENKCKTFESADDLRVRNKLWKARYDSWYALKAVYPGRRAISTDVCVPISKIPEVLLQTKKDIDELGLKAAIVGHVGDGNFHTFLSLDVNNQNEMRAYREYNDRLIRHGIKLNGTCTGEHGIGLGITCLFCLIFLKAFFVTSKLLFSKERKSI